MSAGLPAGTPRIQPFLSYLDVSAAVECLTRAFGFRVEQTDSGPHGTAEHALLDLHRGRVMARRTPAAVTPTGSLTYVYVDDVDAHFERAKDAGLADLLSEPTDQPWGDRICDARDAGGHPWAVAQRIT